MEIVRQLLEAVSARGRSSGLEVEWKNQAGVWSFRQGRVVKVVWFTSLAEALETVGLGAG